uniref:ARM repeat-containing protein n=1 Tax=Psilocybe cubensis TaxID=181762 RepID=A0A8H7XS32_PSICU
MPGPGSHKKSKSKAPRSQENVRQIRMAEIDNAEGWNAIVTLLCDLFQLPDLTSRTGLKQVHTKFNTVFAKIEDVYQRNPQNYKLRGGIIGIFAKMCVDSLLRDKLFEKGVLGMITPLLEIDDTRHLALRCLSTITHHGGSNVRIEIAKYANVLAKLVRNLPDDEKVAELAVSTLAHSITAVTDGFPIPASPAVLKSIDMVEVLKSALEAVKRYHSDPLSLIDHAIELVCMSSMHTLNAFKAYPPAINFMIAGLRSKDWVTRATCLGGMLRLYQSEAEENPRIFDTRKLLTSIRRRIPDHLIDLQTDYGFARCEFYLLAKASGEFPKAMMACVQTHDFHALGLKLVELILAAEFSVVEGTFDAEDPVTGKRLNDNAGLPFKMWSESLPFCAQVIRKLGKPNEADIADILDLKYLIMTQRIPDAVALAKKCIERNPQQAYFHYAITLAADNVQGLRAAKKGLKCKLLTPFVKWQLTQRAVIHAADMGVKILQDMPDVGDKRWEEGIAFLSSACEDAKSFLEGAPPDNRYMKDVGYWYILLSMLLKDDLSADLHELKPDLERLKAADEFSIFMGLPPPKTELRLAQQTAVKHYPAAIKEFSRVFDLLDKCKGEAGCTAPDQDKLEDDLAAWLGDMKLKDGTMQSVGARCPGNIGQAGDVRRLGIATVPVKSYIGEIIRRHANFKLER